MGAVSAESSVSFTLEPMAWGLSPFYLQRRACWRFYLGTQRHQGTELRYGRWDAVVVISRRGLRSPEQHRQRLERALLCLHPPGTPLCPWPLDNHVRWGHKGKTTLCKKQFCNPGSAVDHRSINLDKSLKNKEGARTGLSTMVPVNAYCPRKFVNRAFATLKYPNFHSVLSGHTIRDPIYKNDFWLKNVYKKSFVSGNTL